MVLVVAAVIGIGTSAAALTGVITITPGAESLQLVNYTFANVTLRNVGSSDVTLVKVDVERAPWAGYTPHIYTVYLKSPLVIGSGKAATFSESFTGSGYNVTAHIVTERGHIFTWSMTYVPPQPHQEVLIITGGGFFTSWPFGYTSVELDLGSSASDLTLRSYAVIDQNGNRWENASWGMHITGYPPTAVTIAIRQGRALYTGVPGAFDGFIDGNQYTIVLVTSTTEKFLFSATAQSPLP